MKILYLIYNYLNNSFLNHLAYPEIIQLKGKGVLCTKGIDIIKLIVHRKYAFQTQLDAAGINLSLFYVFDKHDYYNTLSHLSNILMILISNNLVWVDRYDL